jgi:hypothetical protein
MAGVMKAIGIVTEVLGIVSFLQSNLPGSSPRGAAIRVKVGLEDNSSNNYVTIPADEDTGLY